jgi:serine/threonine-protein kinase RsbW
MSGVYDQTETPDTLRIAFGTDMHAIDRVCGAATEFLSSRVPGAGPHLFAVNLILREGLTNAVRHGNRSDPRKLVTVILFLESPGLLTVTIEDQGAGFAWKEVRGELPEPDADHGRGLAIIAAYCSGFHFNDAGNILTFRKDLSSRSRHP